MLAVTAVVTVLYAVGLLQLGVPPGLGASASDVLEWFVDNAVPVKWFVWTITVATPFLAIGFALLRRLLPPIYRDVFLIGAVLYLAESAITTWFWGGLATLSAHTRSQPVRQLLDILIFFGPVLTGATMTMMAPVSWLALRAQNGLPRWLGILGAVAFIEQAIETITIFGSEGFTEPGGTMNMQLGAALTLAWLLGFALWGGLRGRFENSPVDAPSSP